MGWRREKKRERRGENTALIWRRPAHEHVSLLRRGVEGVDPLSAESTSLGPGPGEAQWLNDWGGLAPPLIRLYNVSLGLLEGRHAHWREA